MWLLLSARMWCGGRGETSHYFTTPSSLPSFFRIPGPSTKENNENSTTSVSAKIEEPSGGAAESSENSDKKIEDTADNNSDNKNSREKDSNSENLINNTPHKKRRLSEEPSSSNSNSNLKSPLTTKGPKDEKSKWKEHLVLFMNTLNLLIGMCGKY